jgi:hypothetical protein
LLMDFIALCIDTNVLVFTIKFTNNFKDLSFLIDNCWSLVLEELPPSWVGSGTSDVRWSSVGLNVEWVGLPVVVLDCLGDLIEVPLLGSSVLSPSL